MGKDEEKKVPGHIEEFYKRGEKIEDLLNSTEIGHVRAYTGALDHIKEEGQSDGDALKALEDDKVRQKFIDKIIDNYISHAVDSLGIKEAPEDAVERDIILQRYVGVTSKELTDRINNQKSGYTIKTHEGERDKIIEKQKKEMNPLRHSHLEKKHIGDILEHTGTANYFDKDNLERVEDLVPLLDAYKLKGEALTLSDLKQLGMPNAYLTKEAAETTKKLKDNYKKAA